MRYRDTVVTTFVQWLVLMPDKGDIERMMSHGWVKVTAEQRERSERGIGEQPLKSRGLEQDLLCHYARLDTGCLLHV